SEPSPASRRASPVVPGRRPPSLPVGGLAANSLEPWGAHDSVCRGVRSRYPLGRTTYYVELNASNRSPDQEAREGACRSLRDRLPEPLNYKFDEGPPGRACRRQARRAPTPPHANAREPSATITRAGTLFRVPPVDGVACRACWAGAGSGRTPKGTMLATACSYATSEVLGTLLQP